MVQFPDQIVQQIILVDANGNTIVQIGPNPEIDIFAVPPSLAKMVLSVLSNVQPAVSFYDANGNFKYLIYNNVGSPSRLIMGSVDPNGPQLVVNDDVVDVHGVTIYGSGTAATGLIVYFGDGFIYAQRGIGREDWIAFTLHAGWTAASGTQVPSYKILPDGRVIMRGIANTNAGAPPAGTVAATLPAGYRPARDCYCETIYDSSATRGRAVVRSATGNIELYEAPNAFPCFDIMTFSTI